MRLTRALRYLWAGPATLVGLGVVLLGARHARVALVGGVIEAHGPRLARWLGRLPTGLGGAAAITLGHVVIGVSGEALETTRAHERVHVAQYERWGPVLVPAYLLASTWAVATGRHHYLDNWFEREARAGSSHPARG